MKDYASQQRNPGKHMLGLGLVVLLHILVFWAISSGLAKNFVKVIALFNNVLTGFQKVM